MSESISHEQLIQDTLALSDGEFMWFMIHLPACLLTPLVTDKRIYSRSAKILKAQGERFEQLKQYRSAFLNGDYAPQAK